MFAPIALLASNFLGLVVHPSVPFRDAKELIAYAKANPGKLTFGSTGEGAFLHFATELFARQGGFKYLHGASSRAISVSNRANARHSGARRRSSFRRK